MRIRSSHTSSSGTNMRFPSLLPFLVAIAICGVIHTEFDKEIAQQLDVDEFKKDMKILDARLDTETDAEREELKQLLAKVEPISPLVAEAERAKQALNAANREDLFEGDIVLTKEQLSYIMANETVRAKRQAMVYRTWDATAPIPFYFAPEITKSIVRAAAAFWNENTCVNFQENGTGDYKIEVVKGGGCYSKVGRIDYMQTLSIGEGCDTLHIATHELEHALGVMHEQSRTDRNNYVRVNEDNIQKKELHNFSPFPTSTDMGLPYDFGSNMHYTQNSNAIDPSIPTLVAVGSYAEYQNSMGGHMPSFLDVLKVNKLYQCDQKCANKPNPCKNGGYLDVRNCAKCVCPEGLGGADCSGNPEGCVVELIATTSHTQKEIMMGKVDNKIKYNTCTYIIKAPAGKRIEVLIDFVWADVGCIMAGMELKTKTNMLQRGIRLVF